LNFYFYFYFFSSLLPPLSSTLTTLSPYKADDPGERPQTSSLKTQSRRLYMEFIHALPTARVTYNREGERFFQRVRADQARH
jgi:hypothetical protein